MIIISQDKKIISNFERTIGIQIDEHITNSDGEKDYEIKEISERKECVIGVYEDEERAKEVLQEIAEFYKMSKRYECSSNNGMAIFIKKTFIYAMPKE